MLVLSRAPGESIIIGIGDSSVEVSVIEIRIDGKVRLGINAPKSISVHRREIYDRIHSPERNVKNEGKS